MHQTFIVLILFGICAIFYVPIKHKAQFYLRIVFVALCILVLDIWKDATDRLKWWKLINNTCAKKDNGRKEDKKRERKRQGKD